MQINLEIWNKLDTRKKDLRELGQIWIILDSCWPRPKDRKINAKKGQHKEKRKNLENHLQVHKIWKYIRETCIPLHIWHICRYLLSDQEPSRIMVQPAVRWSTGNLGASLYYPGTSPNTRLNNPVDSRAEPHISGQLEMQGQIPAIQEHLKSPNITAY